MILPPHRHTVLDEPTSPLALATLAIQALTTDQTLLAAWIDEIEIDATEHLLWTRPTLKWTAFAALPK